MKKTGLILILSLPLIIWANMASPIEEGTYLSSPFISTHVNIVQEKIWIKPDKSFETAQFNIEYHIQAEKTGQQVPLLFYASEFKKDFKIWVDSQKIELEPIPNYYETLDSTPFNDFGYLFEYRNEKYAVAIDQTPTTSYIVSLSDLKFFEVDLTEGNHVIRVQYTADKWTDHGDWVKEYSFRYVLSPAKYWKSFGGLEIAVDGSECEKIFSTNLVQIKSGDLGSTAIWQFSSLPKEVLEISHQPEISAFAEMLLAISPMGIALLLGLILMAIHLRLMHHFRGNDQQKALNGIMVTGWFIVPFLGILTYIFAHEWITMAIGEEAGRGYGYVFLSIIFYPFLWMLYGLLIWLAKKRMQRK